MRFKKDDIVKVKNAIYLILGSTTHYISDVESSTLYIAQLVQHKTLRGYTFNVRLADGKKIGTAENYPEYLL